MSPYKHGRNTGIALTLPVKDEKFCCVFHQKSSQPNVCTRALNLDPSERTFGPFKQREPTNRHPHCPLNKNPLQYQLFRLCILNIVRYSEFTNSECIDFGSFFGSHNKSSKDLHEGGPTVLRVKDE